LSEEVEIPAIDPIDERYPGVIHGKGKPDIYRLSTAAFLPAVSHEDVVSTIRIDRQNECALAVEGLVAALPLARIA